MRLLLDLEAKKKQVYPTDYHHKLQGFVYKHIEPFYRELHDKKGYKFFCFSNIFPIGDMEEGDRRKWIISSPDSAMIKWLKENIPEEIRLGEMELFVREKKLIDISLGNRLRIVTATPIVIRIPEKNYDMYGIPAGERKRRYLYWRPKYSFEAFVKQLTENLIKKYNDFCKVKVEEERLFEVFHFKKMVNFRLNIRGRSYGLTGSMWEFYWSRLNDFQKKVLKIGIDAGFGERNTFGFGFVNKV